MTHAKLSPDDPRISAYAFNEMNEAERSEFETLLAHDPEAAALVAELKDFGIQVTDTLEQEHRIDSEGLANANSRTRDRGTSKGTVRAKIYWFGGLAAAASMALLVSYQASPRRPQLSFERPEPSGAQRAIADKQREADLEKAKYEASRIAAAVGPYDASYKAAKAPKGDIMPLAQVANQVNLIPPSPGELFESKEDRSSSSKTASVAPMPASDDEEIELSPFMIETGAGQGYAAEETLAGTRINHELRDVGSAITVVSERFKKDLGATSAEQVFHYTTSTGIGGRIAKPASPVQEGYARLTEKGYSAAASSPVSTFSIDVDTASYANVRRFIQGGQRPPREAVRVEELLNYFPYQYAAPRWDDKAPVAATMEVASAPWAPEHRLVRIGLKAKEIPSSERPASNLVFLLDVSGSMSDTNKLPLVKRAMGMLVEQLRPEDHVAIVTYAGNSGLALPSTSGADKAGIREALNALNPGGSTHGAMGIQLAYDIAKANFVKGGVNRVVLCTDGDFNVGVTSQTELQSLIETKAKSGVFLTVLGFGMGNYKDDTLELLADKGNGNYAYIDSVAEARKALVEQAGGTLVTVAKDVKVQVEFNPTKVASYRLIGYENRMLAREDFNNDAVDAGDMGAGHTVTAMYEVVLVGAVGASESVDPLRYASVESKGNSNELLTVKVRYKEVDSQSSEKLEFPLVDTGQGFERASVDFKFASSVAAFGQILTDSTHKGTATLDDVARWATSGLGDNPDAHRKEFVELVKTLPLKAN